MKRLLVLLAFMATPAFGADVAKPALAKAVALPSCSVASCTGFYAGLNVIGNGTNVNILGNGLNGSLNSAGTDLGGHVGYRAWNGTFYLGGEVGCSYDISTSTQVLGASPSDRLRCMELAKLGGALSALFQNQTIPIPPMLQNSFMSFYGILGGNQRFNRTGFAGGVGAEFFIMPNVTMNLEYINVTYSGAGAPAATGVNATDENLFRLLLNYNF